MIKRSIYSFLFFVLVISLLISCSISEPTYDDEYNANTDFPYYFHSEGMNESRIAASDQGYYMLNGHLLYYMDKDDAEPVLLDNRPDNECLTSGNGENCNAYVSLFLWASPLLQYYQDYLYTIEYRHYDDMKEVSENDFKEGEYQLVRRDPDGNNRKVLRTFSNANISEASIHRGYLYYAVEDRDKNNELTYQMQRLSLKKLSKDPEVLYTGEEIEGSLASIIPYGSQIYFLEWPQEGYYHMKRYDLNDHSVSTLLDIREDGGYPDIKAIHNDRIYFGYAYLVLKGDTYEATDERSLKTYTAKLDGSDIREENIQTSEVLPEIYVDDDYAYVRPHWVELRILNSDVPDEMNVFQDGELVDVIDTSSLSSEHELYPGDDRYMFVYYMAEDEHVIQILDKRDIILGKAQFKTLIETPQMDQETIIEGFEES